MRPRRFRSDGLVVVLGAASLALAVLVALPAAAWAQSGIATEGALFLLIPVGANAISRGQAAVASRQGADGTWWNPASIAWADHRELSVDHAATAFIAGDAIDAQLPMGRAGVLGASALLFNFGEQGATDEFGNTIGTIYSRALVLSTTYAATFGANVAAGVTYKYVQQSQSCSGACQNQTTFAVSTSAFDFGAQISVDSAKRLTLGVGVRNAGFSLQTIDKEQADPLPTRVHAGAEYRVSGTEEALPGAVLRISAEVVTRTTFTNPAFRGGAELALADRVFLRGGALTASGDAATAAVGFGYRQGMLGFDIARSFGGVSADAGEPPTYITVRFGFR